MASHVKPKENLRFEDGKCDGCTLSAHGTVFNIFNLGIVIAIHFQQEGLTHPNCSDNIFNMETVKKSLYNLPRPQSLRLRECVGFQ